MEGHLEKRLEAHMLADEKMLSYLSDAIDKIKDNHLAHIQEAMGDMKVNMGAISKDVDWLKRFFWIIATASVGSLAASILGLILKKGV